MNSVKQQKLKIFAQNIFSVIKKKISILVHEVCIESFKEFFESFIQFYNQFLYENQILELLNVSCVSPMTIYTFFGN